MPESEGNMVNKNSRPAIENQGENLVWRDRESDLVALEKKELRLQRKLYTLLLVMLIGFGSLALVMYQLIIAFRLDMDGMRADMDRMAPAIVLMSNSMSGLTDHISTMTGDVSGIHSIMGAINHQFGMMNQSVGIMGRDVNRMSGPMQMFFR
ncbi:hypothetical protein CCP4SC76_5740017 [Gammaproteobacteria bacterium]